MVLIVVPLLGLVAFSAMFLLVKFGLLPENGRLQNVPGGIAFNLMFSPIYSVFGVLIAVPLSWIAARTGWAGWGSAILTAAVVGVGIDVIWIDAGQPIMAMIFMVFGLIFWLGAHWFEPGLGPKRNPTP